jgi:hypothetical protein
LLRFEIEIAIHTIRGRRLLLGGGLSLALLGGSGLGGGLGSGGLGGDGGGHLGDHSGHLGASSVVVLLRKALVAQKLGINTLQRQKALLKRLLDAIAMRLVRLTGA